MHQGTRFTSRMIGENEANGGNGEREDETPQQGLCGGGTGHSSGET